MILFYYLKKFSFTNMSLIITTNTLLFAQFLVAHFLQTSVHISVHFVLTSALAYYRISILSLLSCSLYVFTETLNTWHDVIQRQF